MHQHIPVSPTPIAQNHLEAQLKLWTTFTQDTLQTHQFREKKEKLSQ